MSPVPSTSPKQTLYKPCPPSHTWSNWRYGWLAPGIPGPHSGALGSHRIWPGTGKNPSCLHLSAHTVSMVTTGQSPRPVSRSAPADSYKGQDFCHTRQRQGWAYTGGESWLAWRGRVRGGHTRVLTGQAVMFWIQRLMLELSSSVLQCCRFPSQPQYGSRAARHALPDGGPETQAYWLPSLSFVSRKHLASPLWAPLSILDFLYEKG